MRSKQWVELLERERAEHRKEIARLLDRIQHPTTHQVEPGEIVEHEPPRDAAEMAWVGAEVPEFVQVGSEES